MFFDGLDKVLERSVRMRLRWLRTVCSTCSGAITTQHHPARPAEVPAAFETPIEDLYRRMDDLVGRTMAKCAGTDTLLMVLSDHGFTTFRRGIDLNRWLEENGYLVVDEAAPRRGLPGRRGLVEDAGVRHRPDRHLHRSRRTSSPRASCRPKRRRHCGRKSPSKLAALVDPETRAPGDSRVYQAGRLIAAPTRTMRRT